MILDMETVLKAVEQWPAAARRELLDRLADGLPDDDDGGPLSDELRAELDRRLALYQDNPTAGEPWEVVYARLRSRT